MPENPRPARAIGVRFAIAFALLLVLLTLLALALQWPAPAPEPAAPRVDPGAIATEAMVAAAEPAAAPPPTATPERDPVAPPPPPPAPTFEERIARLVALGTRTAQFAQDDDHEAAKASDTEARQEFAALMDAFPDVGERGVAMLVDTAAAGPTSTDPDPLAPARRTVLQLTIATDLARRHTAALAADDRSRIDPLVQSILDVMPQADRVAEAGAQVLGDRPFLRGTHEPAVLGLVQLAGEGTFPRPIATRLLLTLWDNLQRTGERSSDELSRLAMLLLADADPSKRTAACRQLLGDPRYRAMAIVWLREHGDRTVAAELAGIAAHELEPAAALAVLRELAPLLQRAPNAFLVLGTRAPEVLADAYRELLAGNTQPGVRTDLIAGLGFAASPLGREITELALRDDPSPEVRIQAVFAMTATGAEAGERAMQQLLDDPAVAQDGNRLGALVLALHNLEAAGDPNAIERVGRRLRSLPLSEGSRQSLEALLVRSLPGGGSNPPR